MLEFCKQLNAKMPELHWRLSFTMRVERDPAAQRLLLSLCPEPLFANCETALMGHSVSPRC